jgi:hypothetical protein
LTYDGKVIEYWMIFFQWTLNQKKKTQKN